MEKSKECQYGWKVPGKVGGAASCKLQVFICRPRECLKTRILLLLLCVGRCEMPRSVCVQYDVYVFLTNKSCDLSSYMYMLCTHASRTTEGTHTLYNKICTSLDS